MDRWYFCSTRRRCSSRARGITIWCVFSPISSDSVLLWHQNNDKMFLLMFLDASGADLLLIPTCFQQASLSFSQPFLFKVGRMSIDVLLIGYSMGSRSSSIIYWRNGMSRRFMTNGFIRKTLILSTSWLILYFFISLTVSITGEGSLRSTLDFRCQAVESSYNASVTSGCSHPTLSDISRSGLCTLDRDRILFQIIIALSIAELNRNHFPHLSKSPENMPFDQCRTSLLERSHSRRYRTVSSFTVRSIEHSLQWSCRLD